MNLNGSQIMDKTSKMYSCDKSNIGSIYTILRGCNFL